MTLLQTVMQSCSVDVRRWHGGAVIKDLVCVLALPDYLMQVV